MQDIFYQIPLYRFLMFCNESGLEKKVLDCGAGGECPPLSLFSSYGYLTEGIEFDDCQLEKANDYARNKNIKLNINQGDMRKLSFDNEVFSFVYSYNSVFHMTKEDVNKSINEMKRVLKKDGLLFVNFLTVNDFRCGEGIDLGQNQYNQKENGSLIIHSYFDEDEADSYFIDMELVYKENRVLERSFKGKRIKQGFVDYIIKKK